MKRILINATHNEEIRVALCTGNHMYDFDLENRTREQKKSNIYKAHVTRVEPSLEAVFVEYGAKRQGFLPIREIAKEYLAGNPRNENIRNVIKEGDSLIVQVEKEERGNKGAALSTYISLAGRYLVLMPNNPRGGGISRQISGKMREDMKRIVANLEMPKGMSVIIRTAGIGKSQEDLQHDLNHLLNTWRAIGEQNSNYDSPRLVHQEAGVVTRAVRDYLRDDISEIWVDNEEAYNEAAYFIKSVMPKQLSKLFKYTDYEPMFARFGIEKQIETAYQREVRLPSGGSIVIDQTEAMVAIDINSAKSTKGSDVAATAYHTNLEAAEEIARQLRLRDMGGLVVIDFIDMYDSQHQKDVEKCLVDSTKYDRARVQFGDISKFGLMEMSRQRLRPSLEESTGYKCPRCHGNGMIRDLRSLGLSIMRQIEQVALTHRSGELQAEVPNDIAAFLLNEKRDSLVFLEQDSGTRITILPHAHLESPEYHLHYNSEGFAPSSYERISDSEEQQTSDRGYEVNWQNAEIERPKQQPVRKPRKEGANSSNDKTIPNSNSGAKVHPNANKHSNSGARNNPQHNNNGNNNKSSQHRPVETVTTQKPSVQPTQTAPVSSQSAPVERPQAVAWLSNLFAPTPQAQVAQTISSQEAAQAIESIVNNGGQSLGSLGQVNMEAYPAVTQPLTTADNRNTEAHNHNTSDGTVNSSQGDNSESPDSNNHRNSNRNGDSNKRQPRKPKHEKGQHKKDRRYNKNHKSNRHTGDSERSQNDKVASDRDNSSNGNNSSNNRDNKSHASKAPHREKREANSRRESRGEFPRQEALVNTNAKNVGNEQAPTEQLNVAQPSSTETSTIKNDDKNSHNENRNKANTRQNNTQRVSDQKRRERNRQKPVKPSDTTAEKGVSSTQGNKNPKLKLNDVSVNINPRAENSQKNKSSVVHLSLDKSKPFIMPEAKKARIDSEKQKNLQVTNNNRQDAIKNVETVEVASVATIEAIQPALSINPQPTSVDIDVVEKMAKSTEIQAENVTKDERVMADKPARVDGRAHNDPRVVREQLTNTLVKTVKTEQPPVVVSKPIAPFGTVGEFLRMTLKNAEERIKTEGIIACFIDAIDNAPEQVTTEGENVQENNINSDDKQLLAFDFSNYGYQPLSNEYLNDFHGMVTSMNQFSTGQGKTDVAPTPVVKRAENDPRGQHPAYQTETQQVEPVQADVQQIEAEVLPVQSVELVIDDSIVESDSMNIENDSFNIETESVADVIDNNAESMVEAEVNVNSKERSKTTFDKYKSMLADVSEQLSTHQTGKNSLFLSSAATTVPKVRARKKKDDE